SEAIAKHFADLGFKFAIYSDHQIHPRFCQAANFLHAYVAGTPTEPISDAERDAFIQYVREHSGIRLTELPFDNITRRNELALHLIAKAQVFTSLSEADFTQLDSIRLYATPQDEEAFHQYLSRARPHTADLTELGHRLRHGALIEIRGRDYEVTRLTKTMVRLQPDDGDPVELATQSLLDLKPRIGGIRHAEKTFERMFQEAPPEYRTTYYARLSAISPYLRGGSHHGTYPSDRTTRRWYYAYTNAVKKGLSGDAAIFPKFSACGRKQLSMDAEVETHLLDLLKSDYKTPTAPSVRHVWSLLLAQFGRNRLISKRSLYRRIARIDPHSLTWAREGKRSAIRTQPLFGDSAVFGSPHRQRSFQRAHIDSTLIDLKHPNDDRHTVVRMVDSFDGRTLAWHLSKEGPSDDTIQALFINCVKNHGAIPAEIVCDFGPEHRTTWLQETLAALNVVLDYRPKSDPPKGGPVESSFSALARELIHNLEGNTKLMKKVRMLTKAVDPRRLAIWSPQDLAELLDEYFSLKNSLSRAGKPSPDDIAKASEQKYGVPPCNAASTADLLKLLCPFVDGGSRVVSKRGTVRCNYRTYGIRGPKNELRKMAGKRVKVRWKPKSPDTIYAFTDNPREAFTLNSVTPTGPSPDIIEAAKKIAADREAGLVQQGATPKDREERMADFTAATVKKEKAMKKARSAPPSPAAESAKDHSAMPSDDEIPTIHLK
ncbi:MAG: transposase family protein, partial [Dechloromonas sp.]